MSSLVAPAAERDAGREPLAWLARTWITERVESVRVRVCLISALVLIPCFWHSRIQAGDLSSHLYNAWLSLLIPQGKAPGLTIVSQRTNVLLDWILSGLMQAVGPWGAEHIVVPFVVLIFVWGAFAMVCAISRCRPWYILSFITMLAYGWVFHMGFLNFYLALGLSFWALALLWKPSVKSALCAVLLLALASLAHALPVAWAVGAAAYAWVARRILPRDRLVLTFALLVGLVVIRAFVMSHFPTRWSGEQVVSMTGADQISVFESKYHPLEFIWMIVWFSLFVRLVRLKSEERVSLEIPTQLHVILAAAVLLMPGAVLLPGYNHPLRYINERMSLVVAVSCCSLIGRVRPGSREKTALAILMGLYFSFLYVDTRAINYVEDLVEQSVAQMPPGARVVSALCDERRDVNLLLHTVDRACIGRCFSYGNYEPSTAQFRIRPLGPNPVVVDEDREAGALQEGTYVVKPEDEPLYQIYLHSRYIDSRVLKAGDVTGITCFESTPSPSNVLRQHTAEAK